MRPWIVVVIIGMCGRLIVFHVREPSDRRSAMSGLDAPTLPCREENADGVWRFAVDWQRPPFHGPAEGHRETHYDDPASPSLRTRYH